MAFFCMGGSAKSFSHWNDNRDRSIFSDTDTDCDTDTDGFSRKQVSFVTISDFGFFAEMRPLSVHNGFSQWYL
jgi:hypothetical protein